MDDFNKTPNIYPNLSAAPLNEIPLHAIPLNVNISNKQKFRLNKSNEIKFIF